MIEKAPQLSRPKEDTAGENEVVQWAIRIQLGTVQDDGPTVAGAHCF